MDCDLNEVLLWGSWRGKMGTGINLILDWENGIYSLGLGFSHWEWDEQSSWKWEWDFFFLAVFAPILWNRKNKILQQKTLHSSVETVKSVFSAFAPAVQLPGLHGCIVTFCQFSWSAHKFCKFAYGGKILWREDKNGFGKGFSQNGTRNQVRQCSYTHRKL